MRIEQFTLKAQEALQAAQTLARRMGSPEVEPEHLAKALLNQEQGVADALLRRIGTDPGLIQSRVDEALERLPRIQGGDGSRLSQRLLRDLDKAEDEAKHLKDEYVSSEHLLIALAQDKGAVGEALKSSGISRDRILTVLKDLRGGKRVTTAEAEDTYQALEKYGRDLTAAARAGKLDPVIGRDEEIRRVIQVLSRPPSPPCMRGRRSSASSMRPRTSAGSVPIRRSNASATPWSCVKSALARCSGSYSGEFIRRARVWPA